MTCVRLAAFRTDRACAQRAFAATILVLTLHAPVVIAQTSQTAPAAPPETKVDASRGGVTISSGVNSLTIGARVQFRWILEDREDFDGDTAGAGARDDDGPLSQFDIPRLRVSLSGGVFRRWLRYAFQFEFNRTGGEGASKVKDAVLEIRPPNRSYRVQVGQFKAPFGLQQLISSGRLQFVDRAITDLKFTPSREMGAMFGATAIAQKVGYEVGIFNGSGESVRQLNRSHLWVGRVWVNPLSPYTLSESAVDGVKTPALHLGAAVRGGEPIRGRSTSGIVDAVDNQTAYAVEFAFRQARLYTTAEHFWMIDEQQNPTPAADIDSRGYHAQAGFMVIPKTAEIGVRYAEVIADTRVDESSLREILGVLGYYWAAHNLKLQADFGQLRYGSSFALLSSRARQGLPALGTRLTAGQAFADTQLRVQLQLAF